MPYALKADRLARQRGWRVVNRAKRQQLGLCRDCPRTCKRTTRQTVLCDVCYAKQYERRPDTLGAFTLMKQQMRAELMPLRDDRRRNGKAHYALTWALLERTA